MIIFDSVSTELVGAAVPTGLDWEYSLGLPAWRKPVLNLNVKYVPPAAGQMEIRDSRSDFRSISLQPISCNVRLKWRSVLKFSEL